MGRMRTVYSVWVLLAIASAIPTVHGRPQTPIVIRFIDSSGNRLRKAQVTISGLGGRFDGTTDQDGQLRVPPLFPGRFQVECRIPGLSVFRRDIKVEARSDGKIVVDGQIFSGGDQVVEIRMPGDNLFSPSSAPEADRKEMGHPPQRRPVNHLYWNLWLEERRDALQFDPVSYLRIDRPYLLVVDLSAVAYKAQSGLYSSNTSGTLKRLLDTTTEPQLDLDLYLLYDQRYFSPLSIQEGFQRLPISVSKIRNLEESPALTLPSDLSVKSMATSQYDAFRFGRATFSLRTNRKRGTTFLGVSVWYHGTPIEEITLPSVCLKDTDTDACAEGTLGPTTLGGIDSAILTALDRAKQPVPAAAIHFIDFEDRGTAVVLRCNDCSQEQSYFTWRIGRRLGDIAQELRNSILSNIDVSAQLGDPAWLDRAGKAISNLLLYGDDPEESQSARKTLTELMARTRQGSVPALFIRSLSRGADPFFLVPIGLASLDMNGRNEHIGYYFRIESPLLNPSYKTGNCVDTWRVLVPDERIVDSALAQGRDALKTGLARFGANVPKCTAAGTAKVCVFKDIDAFSDWINRPTPEQPNMALLVMSHHDQNRIYWDQANTVPAALFQAQFQSPSIVVFNACGTAKPGETEVLRRLNLNGVSSVIATYSEVPGSMAGRFSTVLIDILRDHKNDNAYSLSQAVYDAIIRLRDEPIPASTGGSGKKYGAFALLFALIGNGGVRLCIP